MTTENSALTDAEIEAGFVDDLPDAVAAELSLAHGMPQELLDNGASLDLPVRIMSREVVMRLRAGGISDATIRQIMVFDPQRTRDYYRQLAELHRELDVKRHDPKAAREVHMRITALRLAQHGKYGALAGRK